MALSDWTVAALEWKADVAGSTAADLVDDEDKADREAWEAITRDLDAALAEGRLEGHPLAEAELVNYLGGDCPKQERRAILVDMARAGLLERPTPGAVYLGRKPQTIRVDGVEYETV
jgi:hypothetical protein